MIGLGGPFSGLAFPTNLLGYGSKPGNLVSGGSIAALNWASGIAVTVAMAMVTLFAEFLEAYIVPLSRVDSS